jgi:hypothetical protein
MLSERELSLLGQADFVKTLPLYVTCGRLLAGQHSHRNLVIVDLLMAS